jgi:hypothetical protein
VGGRVAPRSEGERKLRSTGYPAAAGVAPSDPLRCEKALLDGWLEDEFPRNQ